MNYSTKLRYNGHVKIKRHGGRNKKLYTRVDRLPSGRPDICDVWGPDPNQSPIQKTMVCDCCLSHVEQLWLWHHRGFCVKYAAGLPMQDVCYNAGIWAMCEPCQEIFLSGAMDHLAARVKTLNPIILVRDLEYLCGVLPKVIFGDPQVWHSGQSIDSLGPLAESIAPALDADAMIALYGDSAYNLAVELAVVSNEHEDAAGAKMYADITRELMMRGYHKRKP